MHNNLKYLIHFYTDKNFLFNPITSYTKKEFNLACDSIVKNNSWFMKRYGENDRNDYYERRIFVEKQLKNDFYSKYSKLLNDFPIYFYLIPNISDEKAKEMCEQRKKCNENTKYILLKTELILYKSGVTFTICDSFRAYWKKAISAGIKCRPEEEGKEIFDDHNDIFEINEINDKYKKYFNSDTIFEIQIWNKDLINDIKESLTTAST